MTIDVGPLLNQYMASAKRGAMWVYVGSRTARGKGLDKVFVYRPEGIGISQKFRT